RGQFRMAGAAVNAPFSNDTMNLLEMPIPGLGFFDLSWNVMAGCATGAFRCFFRKLVVRFGENRRGRHATGDDARSQERSLQSRFAVDSSQPGRLSDGIQTGNRLFL